MSEERTITVSGMACTGCEATVEDALEEIEGVESAAADHETGTVAVTLSGAVGDETIERAVGDAGYAVTA